MNHSSLLTYPGTYLAAFPCWSRSSLFPLPKEVLFNELCPSFSTHLMGFIPHVFYAVPLPGITSPSQAPFLGPSILINPPPCFGSPQYLVFSACLSVSWCISMPKNMTQMSCSALSLSLLKSGSCLSPNFHLPQPGFPSCFVCVSGVLWSSPVPHLLPPAVFISSYHPHLSSGHPPFLYGSLPMHTHNGFSLHTPCSFPWDTSTALPTHLFLKELHILFLTSHHSFKPKYPINISGCLKQNSSLCKLIPNIPNTSITNNSECINQNIQLWIAKFKAWLGFFDLSTSNSFHQLSPLLTLRVPLPVSSS